jgi:RNA polymerase sigma-70 factor (ECF subfamily)
MVTPVVLDPAVAVSDGLERLRQADAEAVGEIYDRHHVALRAFARRLVGDDDAAEDLVQEVFVTLPKTMGRLREGVSVSSFLISIAINHARHHVRAAERRRRAIEKLAREPDPNGTTPERATTDRELARLLVRALDELPLDQRVAFVLLDVEERTAGEAATITGAPEATMRTRVFHARKRLRAWFTEKGYADALR